MSQVKINLKRLKEVIKEFEEDKNLVSSEYWDAWENKFIVYRGIE